jgi:DNA repair exonuclease SbcCD ATPase subunit
LGLLDKLSLRPTNCSITECQFIKEALEFSNTNPKDRIDQLDAFIYSIEKEMSEIDVDIRSAMEYNDALNRFAIIVREVDKNAVILSKMPNGDMFSNKVLFFERLISGYGFEYMRSIYQYIDLANLFDTYRHLDSIRQKYEAEIKIYESKADVLNDLQQEIDAIDRSISAIVDQIAPIKAEIEDREKDIAILVELQGVYTAIIDYIEQQQPIKEKINERRKILAENSRKINEINLALARAATHKESIQQISFSLDPLMKERDKLHHSAQLIQDYRKELSELQANYDFIEKIKYFSSPTTGIQLVFMELYMGKIIALANELLKLLFNGQFEIQPFVINESEFRIPCRGGGYLNDDISSMSSSQIGMISMILSFALLHHSSTTYNIIKLDEIDGPLDYTNRVYFMDVLNSIMDIMHTEQCIMISHNSELQVDNSDVILLKHDETNSDYNRGNIIWSYS